MAPLYLGMGNSLAPFIPTHSFVEIAPVEIESIRAGDLVAYSGPRVMICHRVLKMEERDGILWCLLKGDGNLVAEGWMPSYRILGRVTHIDGDSIDAEPWATRSRRALRRSLWQWMLYQVCFESSLMQRLGNLRAKWFSAPVASPYLFQLLHRLTPPLSQEAA